MASRSAYGSNPLAGYSVNADNGWGGYAYPEGVPANLLASVTYRGIKMVMRKELAELTSLSMQIAYVKHKYVLHEGWCWSYENRPIGNSQRPSNHSRGRAMDWNAPNNGMGWTWQSDMPPDLVRDMASLGWYWGGYYSNQQTDPMHFEYVLKPTQVAASVAKAKAILAAVNVKPAPIVKPPPPQPAPKPPVAKTTPFPLTSPYYYGVWDEPSASKPGTKGYYSKSGNTAHGGRTADQPAIKRIQKLVGATADGIYGPATKSKVAAWQRAHGLAADGKFGSGSWKKAGL